MKPVVERTMLCLPFRFDAGEFSILGGGDDYIVVNINSKHCYGCGGAGARDLATLCQMLPVHVLFAEVTGSQTQCIGLQGVIESATGPRKHHAAFRLMSEDFPHTMPSKWEEVKEILEIESVEE